ncbi:unnamed protein product [Ceratitis capitata]|uniref:(Mediterranean fruit fly) hypothetical protein n=1 Tax=Ceratitis capitata TaxID=7213 RepID=A0A811VGI2_CERCA|nr:unnamed protein product [Ceratitis capitata]
MKNNSEAKGDTPPIELFKFSKNHPNTCEMGKEKNSSSMNYLDLNTIILQNWEPSQANYVMLQYPLMDVVWLYLSGFTCLALLDG